MKCRVENGSYVTVPPDVARILRRQPGYMVGNSRIARNACYTLARTTDHAMRLYCLVIGQWMDASLADITDVIVADWYIAQMAAQEETDR